MYKKGKFAYTKKQEQANPRYVLDSSKFDSEVRK